MAKFTDAFGRFDVCDLRPKHLDLFFAEHLKDLAPRSRNHYRSTLSVFLKWCVRKVAHRKWTFQPIDRLQRWRRPGKGGAHFRRGHNP